jgi:hypothetical protein
MSHKLHLTALARAAALAAALLVPAASGSLAQQADLNEIYHPGVNDNFGALSERQILHAAAAAPDKAALAVEQRRALENEFRTGQNNAFGEANAPQPAQLIQEYARTASTVPVVGGKRDLVGNGGSQDELAREIYQPGSHLWGW